MSVQAHGEAYSELVRESLQLSTGSFQNQPLPENQGNVLGQGSVEYKPFWLIQQTILKLQT